MKKLFVILNIALPFVLVAQSAQSDTSASLAFSGYIENYFLYDFSNPTDHNRPGFVYSYNRHNEFNTNLGYVKAAYSKGITRANLALMAGTYTNANLAAEPGVLKNIFEANIGVKLSKKHNLWADAGIFSSHIGFESAVGKDCWNLTRSILADNSPYYESGLKVSYTSKNEKWFLSLLVLNGWQHMQRPAGNNTPAIGHQLTWKPNNKITLSSSSFIGNDKPDTSKQMRYFHNFYGQFAITQKIGLITGFDIGAEQKAKSNNQFNTWYSPVIIVRYQITPKIALAGRAEHYNDKNGVIISYPTPHGFQTTSYSFNFDYNVTSNVLWRFEGKMFNSRDKIFVRDGIASTNNYTAATSLAISF